MDQDQVTEAPPVTTNSNPIKERTIHTTVLTIEIKYILEITDNLYADGVEKQDRHDRTETHIFIDRDSYVETPEGTI
jgi:hypothetical protein